MALSKYSLIQYNGTNVGALYLLDVQQRPQLGNGQQYVWGQDIVINPADVIGLVNTGAVLMSESSANLGILYTWSQTNSLKVAQAVEAAGGTVYYSAPGQPTGLSAPLTITAWIRLLVSQVPRLSSVAA
jgi:hypothetical protein